MAGAPEQPRSPISFRPLHVTGFTCATQCGVEMGSTAEGRVPQAPEAIECTRYCQWPVRWNNHAVPSASGRFASQASPVLPHVVLKRVARLKAVCRRRRKPLSAREIANGRCTGTTTLSHRLPTASRHRLHLCYTLASVPASSICSSRNSAASIRRCSNFGLTAPRKRTRPSISTTGTDSPN